MKTFRKIVTKFVDACLILLAIEFYLSGCGHNNAMVVDVDLLGRYNQSVNPYLTAKANEEISCYVDYSYGMELGMNATAAFNDKLKNFLGGKKVVYYKVGTSDNPPAVDINSAAGNFSNIDNFKQPGSKLKIAVDKCVAEKNKTSIFITDFERVENPALKQNLAGAPNPHPIDDRAWAQNDFNDWILAGNQIDIFAKEYSKPDYWFDKRHVKSYQNWIYTIVFTPASTIQNESLYKTSVLKFLNDTYQAANGSDTRHFSYSVNNFKVGQEKKDDDTGDANDDLPVQDLIVKTPQQRFEYYEFKSKDLIRLNTDGEDKRIINKIKITSRLTCFSNIGFGIKVYDATQHLAEFYNAINQDAPDVRVNKETGERDTVANKPLNFRLVRGTEVTNMFEYVFNVTTGETGIKLKPDFAGVDTDVIYQVDFVVKSAKLKDFTDADEVLKLNYANGYTIRSLGESVRYAMNNAAVKVEGKVLYTVYIKIDK
jgi:hypothetical protein